MAPAATAAVAPKTKRIHIPLIELVAQLGGPIAYLYDYGFLLAAYLGVLHF